MEFYAVWINRMGRSDNKIVICIFEKVFSAHVVRVCPINRLWAVGQVGMGRQLNIIFLKLRNMEVILSTGYRHLLSCERNSARAKEQPLPQTDALH